MERWDIEKIRASVNKFDFANNTVYFDFYNNTHADLENLNKHLFDKRPDLILQVATATKDNTYLAPLPSLKNVKKLYLTGYSSLNEIKGMDQLEYLSIYNLSNKKTLDIEFLEGLNNLEELRLSAKVKNIDPVGKCKNLKLLYLSTTLDNYGFMQPLDKIKNVMIDSCIASNDFAPLNKPTLEELSILQINKLENIDGIKDFVSLKKLRISLSKLKTLPEMNKLENLRELKLNLKSWENPEVLKTIPALEKLYMEEINPKLDAEKFYFLTEMQTLKKIDFRFIDFNKKRIEKLNKMFAEKGMEDKVVQ